MAVRIGQAASQFIDSGGLELQPPRMANDQREEFERRLLALVRNQMDYLDEDYPNGWEITEFVVTARYHTAPEPEAPRYPWEGGPYPGWMINGWTRGSSLAYWHDAEILQEALSFTLDKQSQLEHRPSSEDEPEDEGGD
jgi:hypothetical protein